jgi:UPF0271 protein
MHIDLNCDMGEGIGNDEAIMPYISSANIACGYHAGDAKTLFDTIALASKYGIAIGAHVSFLDKENFGRKEINISSEELYDLVTQQLLICREMTDHFRLSLSHVKPHGALYNMSARDAQIAHTIARAVRDFDDTLIIYGLSGSQSITEARLWELRTASEVFADRTYQDDGSLTPRTNSNAMVENTSDAVSQVIQMIKKGKVQSTSGKEITIKADTVCIHGDGANPVDFAKQIFETLEQQHIAIKAF